MFVTGCHRSGTSLLASLLRAAVDQTRLDSPEPQLRPALDNPNGFHESKLLLEINQWLLSLIEADWHRPPLLATDWSDPEMLATIRHWRSRLKAYALGSLWLDKDPRLCITFPAFSHLLLYRPPLAAALRDPLSVATSLYFRDGFALDVGLSLWFLYNHHLSRSLQSGDLLLTYQALLDLSCDRSESSTQTLYAIANFLVRVGVASSDFSISILSEHLCSLPDSRLNRAQHCLPDLSLQNINSPLLSLCQQSYGAVEHSAGDPVSAFHTSFSALPSAVIDTLQRHHHLAASDHRSLVLEKEHLTRQLRACEEHSAALQARVDSLERSSSWRLTAPLRRVKNVLRRRIR